MPPADDAPPFPHHPAQPILVDSFTGDNAVYAVDPRAWTCTCEEWHAMRAAFKPHDVRRMCPHLLHVFREQPALLPEGFKERDRRIIERLAPLGLGYPICRRIVSLPLPVLNHQSGPDSADIFFPRDRTVPWISVLCAEGFFHYHPAEDRWANRRTPAAPAHCQMLELRIHKALSQEGGGRPAGQAETATDPDTDGAWRQHAPGNVMPPLGEGWATEDAPEQGQPFDESETGEWRTQWQAEPPDHAHPAADDVSPSQGMDEQDLPEMPPPLAAAEEDLTWPGTSAAGPPPVQPMPAPPRDPRRHADRPERPGHLDRAPLRVGPQGRPPSMRPAVSVRTIGCVVLVLLALSAVGAYLVVSKAELSLGGLLRSAAKVFQRETPPPPVPGRANMDLPPTTGLQTVPGGHWPPKEQARDILKLIQTNPSQGRYTITKKLPESVVLFGVDLDVQSIYRVERHNNGTESRDSWLGHTMFRLESASQGGSLADVPAGQP